MEMLVYKYFLWADLQNSTAWLNDLGALEYGQALQAAWSILRTVLEGQDIGIYQYVGDSVIWVWESEPLCLLAETLCLQWLAKLAENPHLATQKFIFRYKIASGWVYPHEDETGTHYYGEVLHRLAKEMTLHKGGIFGG